MEKRPTGAATGLECLLPYGNVPASPAMWCGFERFRAFGKRKDTAEAEGMRRWEPRAGTIAARIDGFQQ